MNITLSMILTSSYPDAVPGEDYIVVNDGSSGPYGSQRLDFWNTQTMGPEPSPEEIESGRTQAHRAAVRQDMAAEALDEVSALFIEGRERDEFLMILCSVLYRITERQGIQTDPRLASVAGTAGKLQGKWGEAEAATSSDELQMIRWNEQEDTPG